MNKVFLLLFTIIFSGSICAQIVTVKIDTSNSSNSKTANKSHLNQSSKFIINIVGKHPILATIQLRNCGKEMRVGTFISQMDFLKRWVYGEGKFDNQRVLFFSPAYTIDSNFLNENFKKVSRSIPKNFEILSVGEYWYDNEPNQDSIWFIQLFGQIDKNGFFKIYSAYKVTFVGTDASLDEQRVRSKIKNIEFIFDKRELQLLDRKLKAASKAG